MISNLESAEAVITPETVTLSGNLAAPETLAQVLSHLEACPLARGFTFVKLNGAEVPVSYRMMMARARETLSGMQALGLRKGDFVIVDIDDDERFIPVFWACLLGGVIPAPIASPDSFRPGTAAIRKLGSIWKTLERPLVIIDREYQAGYRALGESGDFPDLRIFAADELRQGGTADLESIFPGDTAFIQFSSGSTGDPKGVVLSHRNILTNIRAISKAIGLSANDVSISWLPHTHDMGLVGQHLTALQLPVDQVKLNPKTFVKNPRLFLELIARYRATIFATPNFGLAWLVEHLKGDDFAGISLASIRMIINGSEPISIRVIEDFTDRFKACGYRPEAMFPVYGLAEASLGVTMPVPGSGYRVHFLDGQTFFRHGTALRVLPGTPGSLRFVEEGKPIDGVEIRIMDASGKALGDCEIGEIAIRGSNVTSGYFRAPEINAAQFRERWFSTGDMGFLSDGNLVVCDRLKNMICIRGKKLFASDLEEAILGATDLRRGTIAVSGISQPDGKGEEIAVFIKYRGALSDFRPIRKRVRHILGEVFGNAPRWVLPVKGIPKTTSGKSQRYLLRNQLVQGEFLAIEKELQSLDSEAEALLPVHESDNPQEEAVRLIWSQVLGIAPSAIGIDDDFQGLGGTSIMALRILVGMETLAGRELSHAMLLECRTIREMVAYLSRPQPDHRPVAAPRSVGPMEVAIIGIGLRFGGCRSPEEFWNFLVDGGCAPAAVSPERAGLCGKPQWADILGEMKGVELFDAAFHGISHAEASVMDPQQRVMLDAGYEAFCDAGMINGFGSNNRVGVYMGVSHNGYLELLQDSLERNPQATIHPNTLAANLGNVVAARISKRFGLTGPALALDTACSTSLVAASYAIKDLRDGTCEAALVGASNLVLSPRIHSLSKAAGILSPTGACRAFDEAADGTVLGEGVACIALELLETAKRNGRRIYAVIQSCAVNNDGVSLGIMAPNPQGQVEVIRQAYQDAGTAPASVTYVEAHGTATAIGDPVEIKALAKVFQESGGEAKCGIGTVKGNLGHLLTAAGMAGIIKTALCLHHKALVPTPGFKRESPFIGFAATRFVPVAAFKPWSLPDGLDLRRASVSSFGFGGTNAHMLIRESGDGPGYARAGESASFLLTAKNPQALLCNARDMAERIRETPDRYEEFCRASLIREKHHPIRKLFRADDLKSLSVQMDSWSRGTMPETLPTSSGLPLQVFFHESMGMTRAGFREMSERFPAFAAFAAHARRLTGIADNGEIGAFLSGYCLGKLLEEHGVDLGNAQGSGIGNLVARIFTGEQALESVQAVIAARGSECAPAKKPEMPAGALILGIAADTGIQSPHGSPRYGILDTSGDGLAMRDRYLDSLFWLAESGLDLKWSRIFTNGPSWDLNLGINGPVPTRCWVH